MLRLALALLPALFAPQTDSYALQVDGSIPKSVSFSIGQLSAMSHASVKLKGHDGVVSTYEGAPIDEVLSKAGLQMAEHVRGKELATYVLVVADDGYEVAFGLGELEPSISEHTVLVAYSMDSKPLRQGQGPIRIVVEGDKKEARCVRMVKELKVVALKE